MRVVGRLLLLCATLLALALGGRPAWAEGDAQAESLAPHDVGVVVQPAAAPLPAAPADFETIDGGFVRVELPSSVRERVEPLVGEARSFRARLSGQLGQPVLDHVLVRVARDPDQLAALAPVGAPPPAYASAVAYPSLGLAILSLKAPRTWEATDLVELLRHELMHVALADAVAGHHVPRWFDEGLAIHESGELWAARLETLWQASLSHTMMPFAELDRGFPADGGEASVAYAEAADVVRFMMRDEDLARFGSLVQRVRGGAAFDRALADAYDTDLHKLEYEWREDVGHRFGMTPLLTGGGVLWALIVVLTGVAWVRRRRKAKAKLDEWAREEAELEAAEATARERLAREGGAGGGDDDLPEQVPAGLPVVEHEGRWYTVH